MIGIEVMGLPALLKRRLRLDGGFRVLRGMLLADAFVGELAAFLFVLASLRE